jgi:protein FRA10AC1
LLNKYRIGLRWCNEQDIIKGKGIKLCGNTICDNSNTLDPYEVTMRYKEHGEEKIALVKVYLCMDCAEKLNYKFLNKKRKKEKKEKKEKREKKEKKKHKKEKHKKSRKEKKLENENEVRKENEILISKNYEDNDSITD